MTFDPGQADVAQQVGTLETACRHLLLRPDDALAREGMSRTIAAIELAARPGDGSFVRGLVDEVRAHAESLAFRLEGVGYDSLHIRATTALLCQALAHLKLQLPDVTAGGDLRRHEFGVRL